jgi:hypothetical protein
MLALAASACASPAPPSAATAPRVAAAAPLVADAASPVRQDRERRDAIAPTTYVDWHATQTIDGLETYVSALEVKRDTDGSEVLQVGLRLRLGGEEHEVGLSGRDGTFPSITWRGYRVELRGGSTRAVGLAVTRTSTP